MVLEKKRQRDPQLPTSIKNKLRGNRSSREAVSGLRATIKVDLFPALLKNLPLFPFRGKSLLPTVRAKAEKFRTDLPVLSSIPIERELAWAAAIFRQDASEISRFVVLKSQFEADLLLGRHEDCEATLDTVEKEFGFSIWLLELRIAFLQTSQGLEAQKAYLARIRSIRRDGDLISFLAHFTSWRNEETTNPFQFKKTVSERSAEWSVPDDFRAYLLYRLTGECPLDDTTISAILRYEASYSLIDYYETFIRITTRRLSNASLSVGPLHKDSLLSLVDTISDSRLLKLLSIASDSNTRYLRRCQIRSLMSDDALLMANYGAIPGIIEAEVNERPDDIRLWFNAAIAELDSNCSLQLPSGLGSRFTRLLKAVMEKKRGYQESVLEAARLVLNYGQLPSALQFEAFFLPQLSSNPRANPKVQVTASASSRFLEPAMLRFTEPEKRFEFASVLHHMYGNHRVIDFEKWRSGQEDQLHEQFRETIAPPLFKEVLIEHFASSSQYDEALHLARQLEAEAGPRYRRLAQRWIAECLFSLEEIEEVIEYVCRVCISDLEVVPMMPLARCAGALNKERRAALAGNLSSPIILDIYDRRYESIYESERNYAYEDFLTAHGVQRPSQLKDKIHEFDHDLIVYYLQFLCIPEVMQVSTAFGSSRELDEERLGVCAILAEIDPDNIEEHETEIRDITRKLVVRRGVREVEQSKIYVDMPAIRRWAEKNLKEGFTRYQALSSAGLDAGGAGIDEAVRDMLAGTPVSEEYLRLPKNEMSGLLVTMVTDFFEQCLKNPAHGLDCYLSMRIRHGALAGQLRAPLEQEVIISQREGPLDEYKPNEYWKNQYEHWPAEIIEGIDKKMRAFSKDFDSLVDRIASDYLQIFSTDKPKGLFHLSLNALVVRALASDITPKVTFDDFLNMCTYVFWQLLDTCLKDVHRTIEYKVKPEMTQLFESLRTELKRLQGGYSVAQLDAAILNAQTKAQQALEQVKDWFRLAKPLAEREFRFREIVEIGIECVRNLHPDFRPNLHIDTPENLFRVTQLTLFSDIFFIIFDNVRKHSGLAAPEVNVSASVSDASLKIEIRNNIAGYNIAPEREKYVSQIRETIAQGDGEYLRAVRSEGGTGLKKLRNILRREASSPRNLDFGFDGQVFFVQFDLPILGVLKAVDEKIQHG